MSKKRFFQSLSLVYELGFAIALPIVGGSFLGSFLDAKLNTFPKLTLSLIFFGVFIGLANMYNIIKEVNK